MIFAIYLDFGSSPFYGDSSINLFSCSDWKSVCELWLKALINLFTFSFVLLLGGLLILLTSFILLFFCCRSNNFRRPSQTPR